MHTDILKQKSKEFGILSIDLYKFLIKKRLYEIAKQFIRSSTSIGANIAEAKYAESRKDFIHKLNIALKEAVETKYWLELLSDECTEYSKIVNIRVENESLIYILIKSIKTAKKKCEQK